LTDQPTAETAFLVYREADGSWTATTDITMSLAITREATGSDVKTGCREIYEAFAQTDLAFAISSLIQEKLSPQEQTTADYIRNALQDRNQDL
jgi:hypothetical protein